MEEVGLERLFFIPAAQSPFKPDSVPTPSAERCRLLRLALAGKANYELDEQEVRRGGVSYTIDTVRDYRRRLGFESRTVPGAVAANQRRNCHHWNALLYAESGRQVCRLRCPGYI